MPIEFVHVLTLCSEKAFVGTVVSYVNVLEATVDVFVASSVDFA